LKTEYDVIIVDTGVNYHENTVCLLNYAEKILFVSTMETVSLKNTQLGMRIMQSFDYHPNKVKLIINRFTTYYGVNKRDIEEVFKDGIFAMIPEEENTVNISVNTGIPFYKINDHNRKKICRALEGMCENLVNRELR
jgi:pilus assembly protein CpaE